MGEEKKNCLIVLGGGQGEIVEKKSRFIATVTPVRSEDEAVKFIADMKKKYWDARHNCSAFVIGERQMTRCSDDGEPSQTAGRPILDVLLREGLTDTAVVVTRYFGGVLLGTGGLVRAYQAATQAGLSSCKIAEKIAGIKLSVSVDYTNFGKMQGIFSEENIAVLGTDYADNVTATLLVPRTDKAHIQKAVTELTNGSASLEWGEEAAYAMADGKPVILQ
ncbi:MAG: YigZ family protein [Clostridiales bacterium]|nr:YigZ family protein [Clostridiales bacterium]